MFAKILNPTSPHGNILLMLQKPIRPSHSSDSRQMSIDSPSDQENDAENSSEEGESSEYLSLDPQTGYLKSYAC